MDHEGPHCACVTAPNTVEAEYEVTRDFDWGSGSFKRGETVNLNPEDSIVNGLTMSNKIRRLDRIRLIDRQKELREVELVGAK